MSLCQKMCAKKIATSKVNIAILKMYVYVVYVCVDLFINFKNREIVILKCNLNS